MYECLNMQPQEEVAQQPLPGSHNTRDILGFNSMALDSSLKRLIPIIPRFLGNPTEYKKWIRNVDKYTVGMSDIEKKRLAFYLSGEPVTETIHNRLTKHPQESFLEFSTGLAKYYDEPQDNYCILKELRTMKQRPEETIQIFGDRLSLFLSMNFSNPDDLPFRIEAEIPEIFLHGLNNVKVQRKLFEYQPKSLKDAIKKAKEFSEEDELFKKHIEPVSHTDNYQHSKPYINMSHNHNSVNLVSSVICHRCNNAGHIARHCRVRIDNDYSQTQPKYHHYNQNMTQDTRHAHNSRYPQREKAGFDNGQRHSGRYTLG